MCARECNKNCNNDEYFNNFTCLENVVDNLVTNGMVNKQLILVLLKLFYFSLFSLDLIVNYCDI